MRGARLFLLIRDDLTILGVQTDIDLFQDETELISQPKSFSLAGDFTVSLFFENKTFLIILMV